MDGSSAPSPTMCETALNSSEAMLIARSQRSRVYKCRCAKEPFQGEYCVKVLNAEGPYLSHQLHVLERIALLQSNSSKHADPFPLAHLVRFGVLPDTGRPNSPSLYLVTRWIEGETLAQLAARWAHDPRGVPLSEALQTLAAVAEALCGLAYEEGSQLFIHQDIKPSNIVITRSASRLHAQFVDFDTAFFLGDSVEAVPFGSYGYAAPECLDRRKGWPSAAADVFSFGVTAHEVLAGHLPHPFPPSVRRKRPFWLSYYHQVDKLSLAETLPADVCELLAACMSLDPAERPSTHDLAKRIRRLAKQHGSAERIPLTQPLGAPLPTPTELPSR